MKHTRQSLKETIRLLEIRQSEEKEEFNKQFKKTFDSLRPINLIKNSLRDFSHIIEIKSNVLEAFLPLITNFISGKIMRGKRKNSIRHVIATMVQIAITNFTAKNSHAILEILTEFIDRIKEFFHRPEGAEEVPEEETEEPDEAADTQQKSEKQQAPLPPEPDNEK
ncbi:hypothetical protein [Mangrovibacterium lignilyticum]|uniref:hypothetical protein n=1 Tax=Mangrovibacterium lignilyticum TaxID=2668052 RepID=UPI0013D7F72D|nr:hypothetical protein [Mangrovibacterium lignilyticum]